MKANLKRRLTWAEAALRRGRLCGQARSVLLALTALFLFVMPGIFTIRNITDPALSAPGIPRSAWTLHRSLSRRIPAWAAGRIASGVAGRLERHNVPATEWPIFGSVFFLQATEALQAEWERLPPGRRGRAPVDYGRKAIEASLTVILDPVHHTWVREHWGSHYLHTQNFFFRSLLVAGIGSYTRLTGDRRHVSLLRDQIDTLSAELAASPTGWLADYPGECYPIDVLAGVAWMAVHAPQADLAIDERLQQARRGFENERLDAFGLVPYLADERSGRQYDSSRGTGNSHVLTWAPGLWPEQAADWYDRYERFFWQDLGWAAGWREYPVAAGRPGFFFDIDAGPIIAGFSPAANAFGLAASRANGRYDHGRTLGAQVLAACWPLPDGRWLGCRILSAVGGRHAPHLGEACMLFQMTRNAAPGTAVMTGGRLTPLVWFSLLFYFGIGGLLVRGAVACWRQAASLDRACFVFRFAACGVLAVSTAALWLHGVLLPAMLLLVVLLAVLRGGRAATTHA